ncbi:Histone deacetylase HDT2 [Euphorbia peplus]|nr:Histone deacetylase HDT2 [Euphorbia peplus]
MEFWGVEVKTGQTLPVPVGDDFNLHFSHACLGEIKKDKLNESACLYLKIGSKKLVLGTLSPENFPQFNFDLIFEDDFELSHTWKHGSVFFYGYKKEHPFLICFNILVYFFSVFVSLILSCHLVAFKSDPEPGEEIPEIVSVPSSSNSGKSGLEIKKKQPQTEEAKSESKKKVKIVEPSKDEKPNEDSDSDDSDYGGEDSSDDQNMTSDSDDDDDESNSDDNDNEEAPAIKKDEQGKKRIAEPAKKTPLSDKKAKFETPQKTDEKKVVVHVATPHPSKKIGKTPASSSSNLKKDQSEKPFPCASCNRSFGSEFALQSHSQAKHSATK